MQIVNFFHKKKRTSTLIVIKITRRIRSAQKSFAVSGKLKAVSSLLVYLTSEVFAFAVSKFGMFRGRFGNFEKGGQAQHELLWTVKGTATIPYQIPCCDDKRRASKRRVYFAPGRREALN